mgnify:FL=1
MQEQTKENKLPVVLLAVIIVVLLVGSIVIGIFGGGGKKVETAVAKKDAAAAQDALKVAISEINKAGSKGVYHKNTCSRKIARLSKAVNEIA